MKTKPTLLALALTLPAAIIAFGGMKSGPQPGQSLGAFEPTHVTGADAGTETCPVCKYGAIPAVQVWVNSDDMANVGKIGSALEAAIAKHGARSLKAFVVYINPTGKSSDAVTASLKSVAKANNLKNVAFTYLPSPKADPVSEYSINTDPSVKNTVLVYSNRKVVANFVNLKADASGLADLNSAVEKATTR